MAKSRVNTTQWQTGRGELLLTISAIRTFDFGAVVLLRGLGSDVVIGPETSDAGTMTFRISDDQVAALLSQPTMDRPPYLKIALGAYLSPGAPDRKWGWKFSLSRDGVPLTCLSDHGNPAKQDDQGFLKRDPRTFPSDMTVDGEFDFITLS